MDRIFTARPVNKQAALVTGPGVHYKTPDTCYPPDSPWQDTPIRTKPFLSQHARPEDNLTGRKVGRLLVVGYYGSTTKSARWVVRCACGAYGTQRAKFLKADYAPDRAMCPACDHVEYLRGTQKR